MAQTGDICDKSEEKVSCKECGQSTLLRKKKPADICERCVQAMESRVHGYDAPLNTAKIDETTPPSALALDGVKSTDNVAEVDSLIEEVRMNHSALERQLKATLASYRLLLDQKEARKLLSISKKDEFYDRPCTDGGFL